jgi:hypothetical protein
VTDALEAPTPYIVAVLLWLGGVIALVIRKLVS